MQELSRYIVLNPVRAGMVERAENWSWSSYGITAGMESCPAWFDREWILSSFGKTEKTAIKHYVQFVANGVQQPSPWSNIKNQIYLGSDKFVDQVQTKILDKNISEVPKIQQRPIPKTLKEYTKLAKDRNESIVMAYRSGGYTLAEIGSYHSLHYSTVSRIIHNAMQK